MSTPVPIGVGVSFSNVQPNVVTADFTLPEGTHIITFQPVNPNNPGVVTLYDDTGTADSTILTMNMEGYETLQVGVGGGTYYFNTTLGANILAATSPSIWR